MSNEIDHVPAETYPRPTLMHWVWFALFLVFWALAYVPARLACGCRNLSEGAYR